MSPPKSKEYLTSTELSERWDVTVNTLANWRKNGNGPTFFRPSGKLLGNVRYHLKDVERFEESQRGSAP